MNNLVGGCLKLIAWAIYGIVALLIGGFLISAFAPKQSESGATVNSVARVGIDKACAQAVKRWVDNGAKSWRQMSAANEAVRQQEWLAAREIVVKVKTDFNSIPAPTCYEYALVSGISNNFNSSMDDFLRGLDSAHSGNYAEGSYYIKMAASEIDSATSYADRLNAKLSLILDSN